MIDTITIVLPKEQYKITKPGNFKETFSPFDENNPTDMTRLIERYKRHKTYYQAPPKSARKKGNVYPNMRIDECISASGKYSCNLKLTFSCPKVLWSHSFKEIDDSHIKQVIERVVSRSKEMGVEFGLDDLLYAKVQTLHYCINIAFQTEELARTFIDRLSRVSKSKVFENHQRSYSNDGHAFRLHTKSFEIVFYMKYYDVLESRNRVDKNITPQERDLAHEFIKNGNSPSLIRIEVRMNTARSINTHMEKVNINPKQYWTFDTVFNRSLRKALIKYYWDELLNNGRNYAILTESSRGDLFRKVAYYIYSKNQDKVVIKKLYEQAFLYECLLDLGVKGLKEIIVNMHNRQMWDRKQNILNEFIDNFTVADETFIKPIKDALGDCLLSV